jgi:hypothetical protein
MITSDSFGCGPFRSIARGNQGDFGGQERLSGVSARFSCTRKLASEQNYRKLQAIPSARQKTKFQKKLI